VTMLPCPFCGASVSAAEEGENGCAFLYLVVCRSCDSCGGHHETPEGAEALWNTRAQPAYAATPLTTLKLITGASEATPPVV
jgi:hypothetical protein